MPSFSEPFRNILLEAMATCTPNVATWNDSALHLLGGEISIFVDKASPNVLSSENWKRSTIQKLLLNVRKTL